MNFEIVSQILQLLVRVRLQPQISGSVEQNNRDDRQTCYACRAQLKEVGHAHLLSIA